MLPASPFSITVGGIPAYLTTFATADFLPGAMDKYVTILLGLIQPVQEMGKFFVVPEGKEEVELPAGGSFLRKIEKSKAEDLLRTIIPSESAGKNTVTVKAFRRLFGSDLGVDKNIGQMTALQRNILTPVIAHCIEILQRGEGTGKLLSLDTGPTADFSLGGSCGDLLLFQDLLVEHLCRSELRKVNLIASSGRFTRCHRVFLPLAQTKEVISKG